LDLIRVLETKKVLEQLIEDFSKTISMGICDEKKLVSHVEKIGEIIDKWVILDKKIHGAYGSTLVTNDETISDVLSQIKGLEHKSSILASVISGALKAEISGKEKPTLDVNFLIMSKEKYDKLRHSLYQQVRDICLTTEL